MSASTNVNKREYWYAENISASLFSLGDLPAIPTFGPSANYDLLDFYDKEVILQSTSLIAAATKGWLQVTKVLDGVTTLVSPSQLQSQLLSNQTITTSTSNTWIATQTFVPTNGPAIVGQGDVHAGDGTHHVDSQGVVRIFGLGSVNLDGSLPANYKLMTVGWDGTSKYELVTSAGGSGIVRSLNLNGATVDPNGNLTATSFTGDGSRLTNIPSGNALTPTSVKTSNYVASAGAYVPVDTTSGNVTITLPTAPADKTVCGVKIVTLGAGNTVSIVTGGSDVFNKTGGGTSLSLSLLNQGVTVQYSSAPAIWYVLNDDLALSQIDLRYDSYGTAGIVQTNLNTHTSNTSNPHNTTAAQVGLGNVANALQLIAGNNPCDLTSVIAALANLGVSAAVSIYNFINFGGF